MSSILDALKKAERESAPNRGMDAPRHPLSARSPSRQRFRWWWLLLGVVFVFGISGLIVWQAQLQVATGPEASIGAAPASVKTRDSETTLPATTPRQASRPAPTGAVAPAKPPASNLPVQPGTPPPPAALATPEPAVPPRRQTAVPPPKPVSVPAAPKRPPVEIAAATTDQHAVAARPENDKTFRNDPRIDLQALVWAPEAATRFVVINNRLIKEGGSIGSIAVVKINPDDVLLAEGSDRWFVAFQVR